MDNRLIFLYQLDRDNARSGKSLLGIKPRERWNGEGDRWGDAGG
jgi:hypothetical protein